MSAGEERREDRWPSACPTTGRAACLLAQYLASKNGQRLGLAPEPFQSCTTISTNSDDQLHDHNHGAAET